MKDITHQSRNILHKIEIALKDVYSRSIYKRMSQFSPDPLELNIFKSRGGNKGDGKDHAASSKVESNMDDKRQIHQIGSDIGKSDNNRKDTNDDLPLMLFI